MTDSSRMPPPSPLPLRPFPLRARRVCAAVAASATVAGAAALAAPAAASAAPSSSAAPPAPSSSAPSSSVPTTPSGLLESMGVPPQLAELAGSDSLSVRSIDLLPRAITGVSGSLGLPTTVSNALLSTVGGCQSDDDAAIIACTQNQTLTTEAPLLLRTDPAHTTIVVLGAGLYADGTMRPVLESRLRAALALAQQFPSAPIVVTGGVPQSGRTEADAMFDWLTANGIPAERITKEGRSRSTIENARFTDRILDERGAPAAVVVTSPGHLERALVDFRQAVDGGRPIAGVVAPG